jgi:hypothetical protein
MSNFPILRPRVNLDDVLRILKPDETSPGQWQCGCPAHNDPGQHLAIGRGKNGELLMRCYGEPGCSFVDVINAIRRRLHCDEAAQ